MPFGIDRGVVQALGLEEDLVRRPCRRSAPPCPRSTGSSAARRRRSGRRTSPSAQMLSRMISWVRALVAVTPQAICRATGAAGQEREQHRLVVAGLRCRPASQSMRAAVEPRRRAGLQPAERQAEVARCARASRTAAAVAERGRPGAGSSPMWITPRRKVPVVRTTAPRAEPRRRPPATTPATAPPSTMRSTTSPSTTGRSGRARNARLHRRAVERAVGLRPRALRRRALAAVQQAELDAGRGRPPGPSRRRARRSRARCGPCRARRSPGCTTSRRGGRSDA